MKSSLIIIGENLRLNDLFLEYIQREVLKNLNSIDSICYFKGNDKNLFLNLEEVIAKNKELAIICSKQSFNLVGKIISTINDDALSLKENMLIPSKTTLYSKDSYLLEAKNTLINIICAEETALLPEILIKSKKQMNFLNIIGIDEESCKILLDPIAQNYEIKTDITKVVDGWTLIKAQSYKYGEIESFIESVKALFPQKVIEQKDVIRHISSKLISSGNKITCAESCTGGFLSSIFIEKPGVSAIINGNLITYSNKIKESWLGVGADTLKNFGAVSEQCTREMLEGALNIAESDLSVAVSGIAGPTGGSKEKPVGTVYVGARNKEANVLIERLHLKGDRIYIQKQAAYHAIKLLLQVEKELFFGS